MNHPQFIPGLDLCQAFYEEAVKPVLEEKFAGDVYAAGIIGSGSEVLGFDTEMSSDHHWGPRVMLFVNEVDVHRLRPAITEAMGVGLPRRFRGYPTSYTSPNEKDKGVQLLDYGSDGPINHRVSVSSIREFIAEYIGFDISEAITAADWLTFPDQKLLTITAGRIFHDNVGLEGIRTRFAYYPHDVWLYLLAAQWTRIEQEEHLMGRAGLVGDEIGSAVIASRLVRDLMRLCFLMEKRYAPYPKWFGTAFRQLAAAARLEPIFQRVLQGKNWQEREAHLVQAYEYIAELHNSLRITQPLRTSVVDFFDRPFRVISLGEFSKAISAHITDPAVLHIAKKSLIGSLDQFSDSTDLKSDPGFRKALLALYS